MREIRMIKSDNKALQKLYEEGWELKAISEGIMYNVCYVNSNLSFTG